MSFPRITWHTEHNSTLMLYWATCFLFFFFFNLREGGKEEEFHMYKGWKVFLCEAKLVQENCIKIVITFTVFLLFNYHRSYEWIFSCFQKGSSFPTVRLHVLSWTQRGGGWAHSRLCQFTVVAFHWGCGFCLLCLTWGAIHLLKGKRNKTKPIMI